jgi:carnitine-CoA ligase
VSTASAPDVLALERIPDVAAALQRAAASWPQRPAWTFPATGERLTFAEVERRSAHLAGGLAAQSVRPGDRIGVLLDNCPEFPLLWLAAAQLGVAIVPLSPRYRSDDLAHVLRTAPCVGVVSRPDLSATLTSLAETATDLPPVWPVDDLEQQSHQPAKPVDMARRSLNIQFTSGTTGRPKGCVLSQRYWVTLAQSLVDGFPYLGPGDVMLTAQPFHYVDPQWNVAAALLAGAHLIVLDGFHPSSFWEAVRRHRVTYFYCLAAMPTLLLATPPDSRDRDHRVRVVQCSAIPAARHAEIERRWGVAWFEAFGMTETGADLRVDSHDHDELVGSGCVGGPAAHREVRICGADGSPVGPGATGELQLRGPDMMDGYFGDPGATATAFDGDWFRTGDLAHLDEAGRVYLDGRSKDMIRRSGENIAAREVEETLTAHPGVALAAVVAVADDLRGEEAKAVVVLIAADGAQPSAEELANFCSQRLAAFKVPRYWEFRDSLPLTPSLRVEKAALGPAVEPVLDLRPGRDT